MNLKPLADRVIDYKRKISGVGPIFEPSGDINADMNLIRSFYADFSGKYPSL